MNFGVCWYMMGLLGYDIYGGIVSVVRQYIGAFDGLCDGVVSIFCNGMLLGYHGGMFVVCACTFSYHRQ